MTDRDKSPEEIEREIEAERSALARSLDELQQSFSPERLMNVASDYMRDNGGDVARTIGRQIKDNPMAVALTAVGLAWLIAGSGKRRDDRRVATYGAAPRFRHDEAVDYGAAGTPAYGTLGDTASTPHPAYDDRDYAAAPGTLSDPMAGDLEGRLDAAEGAELSPKRESLTEAARDRLQSARAGAGNRWGAARAGASERMDAASARWREWQDDVRSRTSATTGRVYARSAELRARLSEGTESLSAEARARVMRARGGAYEAQRDVEARFYQARDKTGQLYDDQPLVFGAVAMALGAALGAALPRTHRENQLIGGYRDQAFDEAERVFREESAKARAVAEAAANEAQAIVKEKADAVRGKAEEAKAATPSGKDAVDAVEAEARDAATRIAEAAKSEAKKQDLGGSIN